MNFTDIPLAQWGIPGFIIIVLAGVVVYLYRALQTEKDKRFEDMKESRDVVIEPVRQFNNVAQAILNLKTGGGHE